LLSGRVRIELVQPFGSSSRVLAEVGAGQVVGALAVLRVEPYPASTVAVEPTDTLAIARDVVALVTLQFPAAAVHRQLLAALDQCLERQIQDTSNSPGALS